MGLPSHSALATRMRQRRIARVILTNLAPNKDIKAGLRGHGPHVRLLFLLRKL